MHIRELLKGDVTERDGVLLPNDVADTTVWDELATSNLLDAATSATSEVHAREKGEQQIVELTEVVGNGVLLDLGCGYGRIAEGLLLRRTLAAYIGVDSSLSMLRYAVERKKPIAGIDTPMYFVYGMIDAIPLKDASVDMVVVSAVFLHNHKSVTERSLAEVHRVLRPGGKLFVYASFPNLHSLAGYQGALYLFFMGLMGDAYRNGPVRFFSAHEVYSLLHDFSSVEIIPAGFAILPKRILILPGILGRVYREYIANPVNGFLASVLPTSLAQYLRTHHDVRAVR
jgi:ubiquinone/menaquinone biosynthesis C-methylase UbiE